MTPSSPPPATSDIPPAPTRRAPAVALLVGAATLMAAVLVLDLFESMPQELSALFAPLGPPAGVIVVLIVLAEGLAATYLVASGRHPLDSPYVTHYGTRTLAAGGVVVAAGMVLYVVWSTARAFIPLGQEALLDAGLVSALVGASLLLSGAAVVATTLFSPWTRSRWA